jgi:succinate dehydrogenase/fumarate reductase cytochrome b subunit
MWTPHRISGVFLMAVMGAHIFATRFTGYRLTGEGVSMTMGNKSLKEKNFFLKWF